MMSLKIPFVAVALLAFIASGKVCAETPQPSTDKADKPLAVAIFSRNKTRDAGYEKYADMLRSGLVSQLSGKFTVIDKDDVVNVFERESKKEVTKSTDLWSYLQMLSELKKEEKADFVPPWFRTHPYIDDRIKRVREEAALAPYRYSLQSQDTASPTK